MGLDNGFIVRGLRRKNIPDWVVYEDWHESEDMCEFGYMRKCWGIRNMLVKAYHMTENDFEHNLTEDDFEPTLKIINHFISPKNFNDGEASTIWTYEEYAPVLRQNYEALKWLFGYAKEHPEIEIAFYDSY